MSCRTHCFLSLLTFASVVALAGCQTMAPTSSSASANRPKTLCGAPAVHSQCADVSAATHWGSMLVVGNALEINHSSKP